MTTDADLVIAEPLEGRAGALSQGDWRLISSCPVPLLLVRSEAATDYKHIVAAVDPFHTHGKPAELDEEIIHAAQALTGATQADVQVVHCFVPLTSVAPCADAAWLPIDDAERSLETYREDSLQELVTTTGLDSTAVRLIKGKPDKILLSMVESGEADLLGHGRTVPRSHPGFSARQPQPSNWFVTAPRIYWSSNHPGSPRLWPIACPNRFSSLPSTTHSEPVQGRDADDRYPREPASGSYPHGEDHSGCRA